MVRCSAGLGLCFSECKQGIKILFKLFFGSNISTMTNRLRINNKPILLTCISCIITTVCMPCFGDVDEIYSIKEMVIGNKCQVIVPIISGNEIRNISLEVRVRDLSGKIRERISEIDSRLGSSLLSPEIFKEEMRRERPDEDAKKSTKDIFHTICEAVTGCVIGVFMLVLFYKVIYVRFV